MSDKLFFAIIEFFKENLHTHTDWTGTYVETRYKCDSVEEFINKFLFYIKEMVLVNIV